MKNKEIIEELPSTTDENTSNATNWSEITPCISSEELEDLPIVDQSIIPPILQNMAKECAEEFQTAFEMPLFAGLACVATAVQGKFQVKIKKDYYEPLNTYTIICAEPSELKSPTLKMLKAPLAKWEKDSSEEMQNEIKSIRSKNLTLHEVINATRAKAKKTKTKSERETLMKEVIDLEAELEEEPVNKRLFADDITPESLAYLLASQKGNLAILEAEGGFFSILAGRYSNSCPNLDIVLKGYSNESVRVDRKGSAPVIIEKPCLTMCFLIQPYLLQNRDSAEAFQGRGLDARFMYCMPKSMVGEREFNSSSISDKTKEAYNKKIASFLDFQESFELPMDIEMTSEGFELYSKYMNEIEFNMRKGNKFSELKEWAGKKGLLGRLAGLFHCLLHDEPHKIPISVETIENVWKLYNVLVAHTQRAIGSMTVTKENDNIKTILLWIKENKLSSFTSRECHVSNRTRFPKINELKPLLSLLEEHNYIRKAPLEIGKKQVQGRPTIKYIVNPEFGTLEIENK